MGATGQYPKGINFAWLVMDDSRHVGVFMTCGAGPVPQNQLPASGAAASDTTALLARLKTLDSVGTSDVRIPAGAEYASLGTVGLYVMGWAGDKPVRVAVKDVYEQLVAPSYALSVDQLPEDLAALARANHVAGLNFAATSQVGAPIVGVRE